MHLSQDIKPISYLKAKTADVINSVNETINITQNGEAKAVVYYLTNVITDNKDKYNLYFQVFRGGFYCLFYFYQKRDNFCTLFQKHFLGLKHRRI